MTTVLPRFSFFFFFCFFGTRPSTTSVSKRKMLAISMLGRAGWAFPSGAKVWAVYSAPLVPKKKRDDGRQKILCPAKEKKTPRLGIFSFWHGRIKRETATSISACRSSRVEPAVLKDDDDDDAVDACRRRCHPFVDSRRLRTEEPLIGSRLHTTPFIKEKTTTTAARTRLLLRLAGQQQQRRPVDLLLSKGITSLEAAA